MSEIQSKGYKENPDLLPISRSEQKLNLRQFLFMMFSLNTCIPMFFFGPIGVGLGLSLWQALVASFIGNGVCVIVMTLNGHAGVKHGISFPVQLRSVFGFIGSKIPIVLRGISGTIWVGIEAWNGALALTMIVVFALGVPAAQVTSVALEYMVIALLFYLGTFVLVMRKGLFKGMGRVASYTGPLMIIYFIWLAWWLATKPEFAASIPEVYVSTTGWISAGFFLYLAVQTNWWTTIAMNMSDLSRGVRKWSTVWISTIIGITGTQIGVTALSYYLVIMAKEVLPQAICVKYAPGILAIVLGLIFTFVAPWTTDITANSPPLIDLLMSFFGMRWKRAVVVSTIVFFFVTPWWAVHSGPAIVDYVTAWAGNYGILLGPLFGPMLGHYWVISKTNLNVGKLYTKGPEGYWYKGGFGRAAFGSVILTLLLSYGVAYIKPDYLLSHLGGFPYPGGPIWYFAVICSFVLYLLLAKIFKEWNVLEIAGNKVEK
jgi:NCS1 family nucleobase:cation symporter-1